MVYGPKRGLRLSNMPAAVALLLLLCTSPFCDAGQGAEIFQDTPISKDQTGRPILRFGINAADLESLDPHFAAAFEDRLVVDMIFNGLIRYKPGNAPSVEPDLAESIPDPVIMDGRQVWTFKLRKGIVFHPGPQTPPYEMTADDVVYSFAKAADPKRSAYSGEYSDFTVHKVDDHTCTIVLNHPLSPTLFFGKITAYAGGFIIPKRAVEAMGDKAFKMHPVGTGPFRFLRHSPKESVQLAANDDYFRGSPRLGGVDIQYLPEAQKRERLFREGQLDVIRGFAETEWINRASKDKSARIDIFGVPEIACIHFNTQVKPFDDIRVRKAVAYGLNRDEFLAPFGKGAAVVILSPMPPEVLPGGLTNEEVRYLGLDYGNDFDRAKRLLCEAGFPNGFDVEVVASEMHPFRKNSESLQRQLARIGIRLKMRLVDHAQMHRLIRKDINPIVIYEAWRPNPDAFLTRFFHSDSMVVTGRKPDTNFSHYAQIDQLIESARREMDPIKQIKLWKYAQVKLLEDMVVYPLHYHQRVYARKPCVDYGHPLVASLALYPQFTEKTRIVAPGAGSTD